MSADAATRCCQTSQFSVFYILWGSSPRSEWQSEEEDLLVVLILLRKSVQKTQFDLSPVNILVMKKSYQCSLSTSNNIIQSNSFGPSSFFFCFQVQKYTLRLFHILCECVERHFNSTTTRSTKIGLFALQMTMPSLPPCTNSRNSSMHGAALLLHCS